MTGGALLAIVGTWVLCQVLGGNALGRLGITGEPSTIAKIGQRKTPTLERGD
jgi:hypothetical protein